MRKALTFALMAPFWALVYAADAFFRVTDYFWPPDPPMVHSGRKRV